MRQIVISTVLFFMTITAFGQHVIKGKVLDQNGNPLVGASVSIQHTSFAKSTNTDGSFKIDGLDKTNYKVVFSYVGFETSVQQVATDNLLVVKLNPKPFSINEVTVTSLRATDKSPVAYTNVDKESLAKTNLGQDIPYLLSTTPSLVVTSDAGTGIGYTNFRIRGTDASRINITINGIPYNDPDEQGAYWVDVPDLTSSVENIQVQRGVGTSTNGAGAFGANINIQTDNHAPKASGEISASYGFFNTQKATVKASSGLLDNHWAIDTRISSITSDGYIDRGSVDLKSYFIQAGYYAENTTIKFITFGGKEKTYHAWDGVPKDSLSTHRTYNPCGFMGNDAFENPLYYQNQTDNYIQSNYQLLGVHTFSNELSLNAGLHYTRGDGYYEEYKQDQPLKTYSIPSYNIGDSTVTSSDLVRQKKMGNDFGGVVFSLNYQKDKLLAQFGGAVNNYWGNQWGDVIWLKNYVGSILPITEYYRSKVNKFDVNVYLKANYEIIPRFNVYADLQYRRVNYRLQGRNDNWDDAIGAMQVLDVDKKFDFFNPKFGLFYRPDLHNDLFASFAVANREPTRTNYTDGTPGIWPTNETLYDTEIGYKFHNKNFSLGVNGYFMNYHNQLILTGKINDIGEALTENIPFSYRSGLEFVGSVKLPDWFRWDVSVTASQNRILNFSEFVDVYDSNWNWTGQQKNNLGNTPIAFSPDFLGNSLITFKRYNIEAGLQSQIVGKQYIDNTGSNDRSLPAYFVNNLRLGYNLQVKGIQGIGLTFLINNLFNEQYISNAWVYSSYQEEKRYDDFGFYPQAGRNFLVGVTVKL
jgi:iron complex outermembrane receptor protein